MVKLKRLFLGLALLSFSLLACSLPLPLSVSPTPVTTEPSLPPATATSPAPISTTPPMEIDFLPSGFVVTDGSSTLFFYNADGSLVRTISIGSDSYVGRYSIHVAGGTTSGIPPVVYFLWRGSDPVLIENNGGIETLLMYQPELFRLAGAPGTPYFAYTTASYTDTGLRTRMYFGTPDTIASAAPVLDLVDAEGFALKPLAFRVEGGTPTGIYYTGCLYGIGSELVFDPCSRLRLLNLTTGAVTEILGDGYNPSSISPDGVWLAYAANGGGQPLQIRNLVTGAERTFTPWLYNERGSGEAVFSPDGRYVAWIEARGSTMDEPVTFQTNLRIAETEGSMDAQYLDDVFEPDVGFQVLSAMPVGWLDNDTLLVQVSGFNQGESVILRLELAAEPQVAYLTPGYFLALTYR
ncbi:MAG: hypothetical protein N2049_05985 [Anaerolineales bacterium]|nr:hypothetical protein [Anaerolineales bacterium]MCX7608748.1 hypothetical protein [Anaerolineales bacterium]